MVKGTGFITADEIAQGIELYKFQLPLAGQHKHVALVSNKMRTYVQNIPMNDKMIEQVFGPKESRRYTVYIKASLSGNTGMRLINHVEGQDW